MVTAGTSYIQELEEFVPTGSLSKGLNYFRSGAVQIDSAVPDCVRATVRGGGRYSVVLYVHVDDEILAASCTCSHYNDVNICKHIWAAVLAAESKGHLKEIGEMEAPMILTDM